MTFFSGTDTATLREEGNDKNCFVSLIVNNAGTYCAAITRKVKQKTQVTTKTEGANYEFFGEGTKQVITPQEFTKFFNEEVIQYFMLDVEVEEVENPLGYLDKRFEEISEKKNSATKVIRSTISSSNNSPWLPKKESVTKEEDDEFFSWLHSNRKKEDEKKEPDVTQPTVFSKEEMDEMVDIDKWEPDPTIIHYLVCQMLTTSLIVNKDIDLKQWVHCHMQKKYDEIFGSPDSCEFNDYTEFIAEFMINHYSDSSVPEALYDDFDYYQGKIAQALIDELFCYNQNEYVEAYSNTLSRYI